MGSTKVLFENLVRQNPNDYKSIEYLGDIAGHQKKWDEAIKYYKILKIQFPKKADFLYKFGGALGMKAKSVNKFQSTWNDWRCGRCFLTATKLDPAH